MKYLWDTNIAIYYLQQQFSYEAEKFVDNLLQVSRPCISAITEIELLCWKAATEDDKKLLMSFIKEASIIELERNIKLRTVDVRKENRIKLPDAIIAATAIEYGYTLITRNISDFAKIEKLEIINPWG